MVKWAIAAPAPNQAEEKRAGELVESPEHELRLALVLYGGVSLAIYMHGVARELLRLVQASRDEPGEGLDGYKHLLAERKLRVSIDVISGASAGGLNGIMLAKALVTGSDLAPARRVWVEEADFGKLIAGGWDTQPRSLLDSSFFAKTLRGALDAMDPKPGAGTPPRRENVLDLFVPGTRLVPKARRMLDAFERGVWVRRFGHVFRLKHRETYSLGGESLGYSWSGDFAGAEANASLTRVGRATSAFPVAFRPQPIERDDRLLDVDEPHDAWFSDGGILDNRPFSEALTAIFTRTADAPVRRWVVSVDPDPEGPPPEGAPPPEPDFLDVAYKAASSIPRYQSIEDDLGRLERHIERVGRFHEMLPELERSAAALSSGLEPDGVRDLLALQVGYEHYRRMRRRQVAFDLAERIVSALARPRRPSPATSTWLPEIAEAVVSSSDDLDALDVSYRLRRTYYLLGQARARLGAPGHESELREARARLWGIYEARRDRMWRAFEPDELPPALREPTDATPDFAAAVAELLAGALSRRIAAELRESDERERAACVELDGLLGGELPEGHAPLAEVLSGYEARDLSILPLVLFGGLEARDDVHFTRIDPSAATYVGVSPGEKVAGDALGHFGGFLDRGWRRNDVLWGRLDAAESLVKILCWEEPGGEPDEALYGESLRAIQRQILAEERPEGWAEDDSRDYRAFLRSDYAVGSQGVGDLAPARLLGLGVRAGDALRGMLRGVGQSPGSGFGGWLRARAAHLIGIALGVLLSLVRLPIVALSGGPIGRLAVLAAFSLFLVGAVVTVGERLGVEPMTGPFSPTFAGLMVPFLLYLLARIGLWAVRLLRS